MDATEMKKNWGKVESLIKSTDMPLTALERAEIRHAARTPEQVEANKGRIVEARDFGKEPYFLRENWDKVEKMLRPDLSTQSDNEPILVEQRPEKKGRADEKFAYQELKGFTDRHDYSEAQKQNHLEVEKKLGIKKGKPMDFSEADNGKENRVRGRDNCLSCVYAHEMRLRGFDVTANNAQVKEITNHTNSAWIDVNGVTPSFETINYNDNNIVKLLNEKTGVLKGRYHIGVDFNDKDGHIFTAVRTKNGLIIHDAQKNDYPSIAEVVSLLGKGMRIEILRVDKLCFNIDYLSQLVHIL